MIRFIAPSRNVQSISLLVLLLAGCACASSAFGQQTQSQPGTPSQVSVSVARLYSFFLIHQSVLDDVAAKLQANGRDGNPLRNDLQNRLGFSDTEYAPIRASSQRLVKELNPINAQLKALPYTSANAGQARALIAQREALIYKEINNLTAELSPQNKVTLEKFMAQFFAPKPLRFRAQQSAVQPAGKVVAQ